MATRDTPIIDPRYRVRVAEPDVVFLLSHHGNRLLRGALYRRLVPLIDGRRSTNDIIAALSPEVSPAQTVYALRTLATKGYVLDQDDAGPSTTPISGPVVPIPGADQVRIDVVGAGMPVETLADALTELGATIGGGAPLTVVVTPDYLSPHARDYAASARAAARTWMLLAPVGPEIWIGPVFRPGVTACWECLAHRLRLHRAVDVYLDTVGQTAAAAGPLPITRTDAVAMASELCRVLTTSADTLDNTLLTLDRRSAATHRHHVVRRPNCPTCGVPLSITRLPPPLTLQAQSKRSVADGGHRTVPPEETYARFRHHISPVTGVVNTLVAREVDAAGVLQVYTTGRNLAFRARSLEGLLGNSRTGSSGKGMTAAQARTSGLCEALERYSAVFTGDEPRIRTTYRSLQDQAVHPADCLLVSPRQYATRDAWNRHCLQADRIPEPFDDDAPAEWTPAWSLTRQAIRYLPTALCYLGYPYAPGEARTCLATSSGNAAGNTIEEACLQAVLELIERDAVALWWYTRARRPAVALNTFADDRIDELCRAYAALDRDLWVLDITSDIGVPAFAAIARGTAAAHGDVALGFGAHLDARVALRRALSELNQGLAGALAHPESTHRHLDGQPYLSPDDTVARRTCADYPMLATADIRDDVLWCRRALESRGLEVLVLDLTRPDVGLPVVKVIVPGLRPYVPRLAAGRLYDVPVHLGWIPAPLHESELNPIPMVP